MKKILFPATNRVHLARQQLLIDELRKYFEVEVWEYQSPYHAMLDAVADIANNFRKVIGPHDLVLVRGDRFEMLPIAMISSYRGIKIAHLEGGDLSGAIDNKVRSAITALADIHFATNKESFTRLIQKGTNPDWTFNFGSLDVEYAKTVPVSERKNVIVFCHHPVDGEDPNFIKGLIKYPGQIISIRTNHDTGNSYGEEEFTATEYLKLIGEADLLIGNSSSFIKEASVYGTPVIDIGERQQGRLKPLNVKHLSYDKRTLPFELANAIEVQLSMKYEPSDLYFKPNTSKNICRKIKEFLG